MQHYYYCWLFAFIDNCSFIIDDFLLLLMLIIMVIVCYYWWLFVIVIKQILVVVYMRLLGQFKLFILFYDKISQVLKSTKKHNQYIGFFQDKILSTLNTLVFFRIRFYIKCRLQVILALFIYMYFCIKATVKTFYHDSFNN